MCIFFKSILPSQIKRPFDDDTRRSHETNGSDLLPKRNGERGAAHFKAIFWTLVLAALIYVAIKITPVYISEYQFQDGIQNIARFASVNHTAPDLIKKSVMEEAQKEDLPVRMEDIKVQGGGSNVGIDVDYSVTVDLSAFQWTLNFHPSASNRGLF